MATPQQTQCYDQLMLKRLLSEQLQGEEESSVLAHIETCESCRDVLAQLAGNGEMEPEIREHLTDESFDGPGAATVLEGESEEADIEQIKSLLGPTDDPHMLGRIGHYEINAIVGRGSTGIVFKAMDQRLNRYVAIKMLAPSYAGSGPARQRFEREARSIAAVRDEHVIPVFGVDEHKGLPFIVMEYMPGGSLAQRIEDAGKLDTCEVVRLGMQIARALEAAHGQGIVHRDVKPANVLLQGGVERALVTDFGLARILDEASMTRSGAISGTPQFMSPEQASGEAVDHRSDLFSLGSVMYMACTGHSPFRSETVFGVIKRVCETEPRPIRETSPEIREWLCDFITKLHAKNAADRFQSAKEVGDLLASELAYLQSPTAVPKPERAWRPKPSVCEARQPPKPILAIASVVGVIALAAFGFSQIPQGEETADPGSNPNTTAPASETFGDEDPIIAAAVAEAPAIGDLSDFDKAMAAFEEENYDEAIELFKASIVANEDVGHSTYNIACSYALSNRPDEAFPWLEKASKVYIDTEHYESDNDLKSLRGDQRFKKIIAAMRKVEAADSLTQKGIHLRQQGRYDEANEVYAEVLRKYPGHEEAICEMGLSLHWQGNLDEAIKWHRRAAETDGFAHFGHYNIACFHSLRGQPDQAFEYFEKAIDAGMLDVQHFYEDDDLDAIRDDPRFAEMIERAAKELRKTWTDAERRCHKVIVAVKEKNYDELEQMLKSTDPNCSCPGFRRRRHTFSPPRQTPLVVASRLGDLKAVKLIIAAGADAGFVPNWEPRPLMEAASGGHIKVAEYLLERGARLNQNIPGVGTPLSYAAAANQVEMIKFLLDEGARINTRTDGVGTPLMVAARTNAIDTAKLLLEQKAELNTKVPGVGTALSAAAGNEHIEMMKLLLTEGAEIDSKIDGVGTPIALAIRAGSKEAVQFLIGNGASIDASVAGAGTPLSIATAHGKPELVKLLIEQQADINGLAHGVGSALCAAVRNRQIDTAKLLLNAGADPNRTSDGVPTPLALAVQHNRPEMARLLLKYAADPKKASPGQKSAIDIATECDDDETMLELLKQSNRD